MNIHPSLLAANPLRLEAEIQKVLNLGLKHLHIDMMDYHFTQNFGMTEQICQEITNHYKTITLDVHLMTNPVNISLIESLLKMGIHDISIHIDMIDSHALDELMTIKELNLRAALLPHESISPILNKGLDRVLILAVAPGFSGQQMQPQALALAKEAKVSGLDVLFDGGVNLETAQQVLSCKPDAIVVGSALFHKAQTEQQAIIHLLSGPQD